MVFLYSWISINIVNFKFGAFQAPYVRLDRHGVIRDCSDCEILFYSIIFYTQNKRNQFAKKSCSCGWWQRFRPLEIFFICCVNQIFHMTGQLQIKYILFFITEHQIWIHTWKSLKRSVETFSLNAFTCVFWKRSMVSCTRWI